MNQCLEEATVAVSAEVEDRGHPGVDLDQGVEQVAMSAEAGSHQVAQAMVEAIVLQVVEPTEVGLLVSVLATEKADPIEPIMVVAGRPLAPIIRSTWQDLVDARPKMTYVAPLKNLDLSIRLTSRTDEALDSSTFKIGGMLRTLLRT